MSRPSALLVPLLVLASCAAPRPSDRVLADEPVILLKSVNIASQVEWYAAFAHHSWFDLRAAGEEDWQRIEVIGSAGVNDRVLSAADAAEDERWGMPVRVLARWRGVEAARAIPALREAARQARQDPDWTPPEDETVSYHSWKREYEAWPGPNSNSFVAELLAAVPGLAAELDHNAVGKDWGEGLRLGATDGGLGVEADLPGFGLALGLRHGVELHLAGLSLGLSLWPPGLKIPFLPRIGIHPGWVRPG